jgi:bifunctional ADP-heptose synthase (sugar kinase/adenylyltransferase)
VIPQDERAELLASLTCVDAVLIFEEDTVIPVLSRLRPEIHCKGAEYAPPHGRPVPEADTVRAYGGEIRYMPQIPNRSTTELIRKISADLTGCPAAGSGAARPGTAAGIRCG